MVGLLILFVVALAALIALLTGILSYEMRHPPQHTAAYAVANHLPCDPGEFALEYEEWMLDRPDGAVLPVWEIAGQEPTSHNHQPLTAVFIHGWGHSRIDALARIAPFLPLCDRLVFYDLRGHGESRNCSSQLGAEEDQDVLALLERLGENSFLLVGHSMGAVIAIAAAACRHRVAERLVGIIAYAPYCEFHPSLQGRLHVAGYPARPITDLALTVHKLTGITPRSLSEHDASRLRCPLLIIHGSDDQVAPIEHGRRIARAAQDATFHEVPGAGHLDAHLVDSEEHEKIVREFLKRIHDKARPCTRWAFNPFVCEGYPPLSGSVMDHGSSN